MPSETTAKSAHERRIGIQLPEVEYVASWDDHVEMALLAESLGFDSLWLGDHLLYEGADGARRGPWECLTMLAGLAAITRTIEIGPLVLSTSFRNPAMIAKMAETIDEISRGRLVLGLGAGWNRTEYDAFGFPFDRRVARFAESFEIIRSLLRGNMLPLTYEGEFTSLEGCEIIPRGPRPNRIPLMIGSIGERMLRLTLPHVDMWNIWYADFGNTPDLLRSHVDRVSQLAAECGREPGEIELTAAVLVTAPGGSHRSAGAEGERNVSGISGTSDQIADALGSIFDTGIDHVQIVLDPITPDAIEWLAPVAQRVRSRSGASAR
jgi:alkanesulfonate monooxygenase SsuD/methylene tetrahydromethanopterin reductase-like flavin-dependent oxidoreductase (luciferase family)